LRLVGNGTQRVSREARPPNPSLATSPMHVPAPPRSLTPFLQRAVPTDPTLDPGSHTGAPSAPDRIPSVAPIPQPRSQDVPPPLTAGSVAPATSSAVAAAATRSRSTTSRHGVHRSRMGVALGLAVGIATALAGMRMGILPTSAAPDPVNCTGYPEPRVFVESQDWWEPIPVLGGVGHIHQGMCFPVGQTVSGNVRFDMRVTFHNNKGTLTRLKMQDDHSTDHWVEHLSFVPSNAMTSTFWRTVVLDTTKMPDGVRLFRWYAEITQANGNEQLARAAWPLDVENGKADSNGADPTQFSMQEPPYTFTKDGETYTLALHLPFVHKEEIAITRQQENVVVRIGSFKRHVPLPRAISRLKTAGAKMDGSRLVIRFVEEGSA